MISKQWWQYGVTTQLVLKFQIFSSIRVRYKKNSCDLSHLQKTEISTENLNLL